jgi:hypothetical protein
MAKKVRSLLEPRGLVLISRHCDWNLVTYPSCGLPLPTAFMRTNLKTLGRLPC